MYTVCLGHIHGFGLCGNVLPENMFPFKLREDVASLSKRACKAATACRGLIHRVRCAQLESFRDAFRPDMSVEVVPAPEDMDVDAGAEVRGPARMCLARGTPHQ